MRCRSLILCVLLFSFLACAAWGQSIQGPPSSAPAQGASDQPAAQPGGYKSGGEFSNVEHPDPSKAVPKDTIIVKGAWYSASDATTPIPENGTVANSVFTNPYFGITYPLPANWQQKFTGPPPSDTGSYVLAQITPTQPNASSGEEGPFGHGQVSGHMEIYAQDMFFNPFPAKNALQMVHYSSSHLPSVYRVEMKPTEAKIAGQPFTFYAYWSPAAELHWYVLATEIRCHTVQIVMNSRDTKLLEKLMLDLNRMKLPAEASPTGGTGGGNVPVCIKDYANSDNVIERVDPVFRERRYNAVPVRIIIDKAGNVKHIHVLNAFPEQEKAIMEALKKWKFRPYEREGQRLEVETGIMFGRPAVPATPPPGTETATN
jgi:TonB family protein